MTSFLKVLKVVFVVGCLVSLSAKSVSASQTLRFLHQDHLGSTVLISDDQGTIVSQQNYYPYGSVRSVTGSLPTEKQYTGQVSDTSQTGLYYYNARYYYPTVGIFTQADQKQEVNRYAFVNNNPINLIDPNGNDGIPAWIQNHPYNQFLAGVRDLALNAGSLIPNALEKSNIPVISEVAQIHRQNFLKPIERIFTQGWNRSFKENINDSAAALVTGGFELGIAGSAGLGIQVAIPALAASTTKSKNTITLYKGVSGYDGGDIKPACTIGTKIHLPKDPIKVLETRLSWGWDKDKIALGHAEMSTGWSPGISWTADYTIARDFAEKLSKNTGLSGSVIQTNLRLGDNLRSIIEIYERTGKLPYGLSPEQVMREQEWVFFGVVPKKQITLIP